MCVCVCWQVLGGHIALWALPTLFFRGRPKALHNTAAGAYANTQKVKERSRTVLLHRFNQQVGCNNESLRIGTLRFSLHSCVRSSSASANPAASIVFLLRCLTLTRFVLSYKSSRVICHRLLAAPQTLVCEERILPIALFLSMCHYVLWVQPQCLVDEWYLDESMDNTLASLEERWALYSSFMLNKSFNS